MVRFQFFPRSIGVAKPIEDVLSAFKNIESEIDSKTSNKKSDDVLAAVGPYLTQLLPFELFSKKFCLNISELGLEIV